MEFEFKILISEVSKGDAISYEDALVKIGIGRVQIELVFAMTFVLINVFSETMGISNLIPAAECDLKLTTSSKGILSSMTFLGIIAFGYVWGYLGDTLGRRWVILWSLFFSTIFTIISTFMKNFALFAACRFMTGIFVGGYSGVMYAYIGEFNFAKHRAAMISWISVAIGISITSMPLLALWILRYDFKYELYPGYLFRPWRLALLLYAVPGVIGFFWVLRFPESPRFLLSIKRDDEALEIVKWIQKKNKREDFVIDKLKSEANPFGSGKNYKGIKAILMSLKDQTIPLIRPPYLVQFVVCCLLQFGTFCIVGGINLFTPDILHKLATLEEQTQLNHKVCDISGMISNNMTHSEEEVCDDSVSSGVYTDIIILGAVHIIGFIVIAILVTPERRRAIIAATFMISGIFGFILPLFSIHYMIVACFCFFIMFCALNVSLVNGVACDIFPVNLRSMAVSVSMLVGRLGSIVSANIIGNTLDTYCIQTYYGAAVVAFLCFALSFVITK